MCEDFNAGQGMWCVCVCVCVCVCACVCVRLKPISIISTGETVF